MRTVFAMGLGLWLAACGNDAGAGPVVADADAAGDVTNVQDTANCSGVAPSYNMPCQANSNCCPGFKCVNLTCIFENSDITAGTDTVTDVADIPDIADIPDTTQCLPLFTACPIDAKKNPCCPPYSCMNMGNGAQCQAEGPDVGPPDVPQPDVTQDVLDVPDVTSSDACSSNGYDAPVCAGSGPLSFPAFPKTCSADSDCGVAIHQINCCGSTVAWGLDSCALTPFASAEKQCEGQYPGCGCAAFQTRAEDGYSAATPGDFAAKCDAGTCRSYVPGAKPTCTPQGLQEPQPVKGCVTASDCDFAMTTVDCCGSQEFVGIAAFAKKAYDVEQQKCAAGMAICNCMPKPTTLEDGKTLTTTAVPLACVNGSCLTGTY